MGWKRDGTRVSSSRAEVSLGKGSVVSKTVTTDSDKEFQYEKSLESVQLTRAPTPSLEDSPGRGAAPRGSASTPGPPGPRQPEELRRREARAPQLEKAHRHSENKIGR
ncbi:unnamed protein product [Rangifer tarandus platyrhynchus]|uniref:Uncharacterized protein n=1 Tax=Rangifer tarandus platyrhynchus TaxID=3082113 RepID=A0AC59ZR75_RANTA